MESGRGAELPQTQPAVRIVNNEIIIQPGATLSEMVRIVAPLSGRQVIYGRDIMTKLEAVTIASIQPLKFNVANATEALESLLYNNDIVFIQPADEAAGRDAANTLKIKPEELNFATIANRIDALEKSVAALRAK